jgi:hypothetical protein
MTLRRSLTIVWLLAVFGCRDAPEQTHIVLDVHVAKALAEDVTRIVVHGEKPSGAQTRDVTEASAAFKAGDAPRFVLQPAEDQTRLQVRIVALNGRDEVASAVLKSRYEPGRGLFLNVELGCGGAANLGDQVASDAPPKSINSCDHAPKQNPPRSGSGGGGSSGVEAGSGGRGTISNPTTIEGGSGSAAAGSGGGGEDSGDSGESGAGSGGAGSGGAGSSGAGSGGRGGAGSGGAGNGGRGGAGNSGSGACYEWKPVATISDAIETMTPEAFVAGVEHRDSSPAEDIEQFICRAKPEGMSIKVVGKASRWGCYMPGPGTTNYTMTSDVDILVSRNTQPCLSWSALSSMQEPSSTLVFGDDPQAHRVCRVFHDEAAEGHGTSGARIGQVRQEDGRWVCRYEFYYYVDNQTRVNQTGETVEVLQLN